MVKQAPSKIFIVDDDISVRRSLTLLLTASGFLTEAYPSAEEFLESAACTGEGCILLDIFLTGKTGLDLQEEISIRFPCQPIIYISGQGDIPMSVRALKKGAINFLPKPFNDRILLDAVEEALKKSSSLVQIEAEHDRVQALVNSLTQREYQVFRL
ncbi:MAG: response regulator, partial [Bacteroidales bacterium]|nr:response regulator [Bacteroidales bacterium]